MIKTFECRHGGVVCRKKISGKTTEEVLEKALVHARKAHGVDLAQSKTLTRYAAALVREE